MPRCCWDPIPPALGWELGLLEEMASTIHGSQHTLSSTRTCQPATSSGSEQSLPHAVESHLQLLLANSGNRSQKKHKRKTTGNAHSP